MNENNFIIGIDLGNLTSCISYYDFNQKSLDIVDASGGYGKFNIPTIVSYNTDSKDWVFGEYALLNKGFSNDIIFENIIENLGKDYKYIFNDEQFELCYILSKFLLFLLENIKNINPNAKIIGIVLSVSSYISKKSIDEIIKSFELANLKNQLIKIVDEKECILKEFFFNNLINKDKILLIDYNYNKMEIFLYQISNNNKLICLKSAFKKELAQSNIFNAIKNLIIKKFMDYTKLINLNSTQHANLENFCLQQFDFIFKKNKITDIKLYYNFYYPPFQQTISKEEIFDIILYFEKEINVFFNHFFQNSQVNEKDIKNFALVGEGIEIDFIHKLIKSRFSIEKNFKNKAKRIVSDGACIIACQEKNILPKDYIQIEDLNILKNDIGIFIKNEFENVFFPLIHKNTSILQETKKTIFNLLYLQNLDFDIYIKKNQQYISIKNIKLELPNSLKRDLRTIRFLLQIKFINVNQLLFSIEDFGFGEIFPKTDFKKEFLINLI